MKLFAVLVLASLSSFAFANEVKEENFEKTKTMMLESMDKRISNLQAGKTCVSAAKNREQLKECHKTMRSSMEELKKDSDNKRKAWREKRKEKKEKKK